MKELLEPITKIVWNGLSTTCVYFQGVLSSTWLIVFGIIAVGIAVFCAVESCKDENGEKNGFLLLLSILSFFSIYIAFFGIGWESFKSYEEIQSGIYWIGITSMWVLSSLFIILCLINKKILYSIGYVICTVLSAILFSKFIVIIGVLLGLGALGGGSSYVGTFTDKNGNSYDIYTTCEFLKIMFIVEK